MLSHICFSNNEILTWHVQSISDKEKYGKEKEQNLKFLDLLSKVLKDDDIAEKSNFSFKGIVSENPHVTYEITLSSTTGSETQVADPCPPNQPGE